MGCGSSGITTVTSVGSNELNGGEDGTELKQASRGDSAISKYTTDSGVVLGTEESPNLPGALQRILPPLAVHRADLTQEMVERPKSSEILEQLLSQGLITTMPKEHLSGEAYNILVDGMETPKRRPPLRLESLKGRKNESVTKDGIEERMRQVEERRKLREEELRLRLRMKSARVRDPAAAIITQGPVTTSLEVLHSQSETLPTPGGIQHYPPDLDSPMTPGEVDKGNGGVRVSRQEGELPTPSLEMENDSTFQQTEQPEEIF